MSKKKALKDLGGSLLARENKKPLSGLMMDIESPEPSSKKKLKKLADINPDANFIQDEIKQDTVRIDDDEESQANALFQQMDDEEVQKYMKQEKKGKRKKKQEGMQEIDKFVQKNKVKNQQKKSKDNNVNKESKANKVNANSVQLNVVDLMRIKSKIVKKRKYSEDEIDVNKAQSSEVDQQKVTARRLNAYEQYQLAGFSENQLIEKAKKMSLTTPQSEKKVVNLTNELKKDFMQMKQQRKSSKKVPQNTKKSDNNPKGNNNKKQKNKKQTQPRQGPFAQRQIVFTGEFESYDKSKLIQLIIKLGGICAKSLTKKCTTLFQGSHTIDFASRRLADTTINTTKSTQAKRLGLQIVAYQQLQTFFKTHTKKTLSQHLNINTLSLAPLSKVSIICAPNLFSTPWTQKYKPQSLQQIIGQQSQVKMLREWLRDWESVVIRNQKKKVQEVHGFFAAGTVNSRAALLSGDPGLGKTTTARLVAQEMHYQVSQFNASDIRSKNAINSLESNSLGLTMAKTVSKTLLILDEVDGMSSGDRGGITAIINKIKHTTTPIICICNDRSADKIRSLAAHCYDINFYKPHKLLLIKRLQQIIQEEKGTSADKPLQHIVEMFQHDVRQILSYLQLMFRTVTKDITLDGIGGCSNYSKDAAVMTTPNTAARKLLNRTQYSRMTISERLNCFFVDSDLVPLSIHQNYLGSAKKNASMRTITMAADGFVLGDMLDKNIRKNQDWQLMPSFGMMCCVYPTQCLSQSIGFAAFPSFLGKFSSERKNRRLLRELKHALALKTGGNNSAVKYSLSVGILSILIDMLKNNNVEGALAFMEEYALTPTLVNENLVAMQYNPQKENLLSEISTATKSKMTKLYNKKHNESKLKGVKKIGSKVEHTKYDPVLEDIECEQSEDQEEESNNQKKNQKSKKK